ncbi:hypothetical protein EU527_10360 [Candidatus Thorarchaeota archaeon]|nr:MAG: hypothetical protein EU527_10360 [Candidatus Thorarchaeota archaeon]
MSEMSYDDIRQAWEDEVENETLQDLADLRLSNMISYLSKIRLALASTNAEDVLQSEILTQEGLNVEFMIQDLLELRKEKIMKAILLGRRPPGDMTLAEEEFYNRVQRAFDGHIEFVKESLSGFATLGKKSKSKKEKLPQIIKEDTEEDEAKGIDYVIVRFLRPISEAFLGLDEITYGPFSKEDIATIPAKNAKVWLRDGTASRVVPEDGVVSNE